MSTLPTVSEEIDKLLESFRQDIQDIASHYDDETYQSSNYKTRYARSNINGVWGEFQDSVQALIHRVEKEAYEKATKKVLPRNITSWWIATGFFAQGGNKVSGPFKSRKTALKERELLEKRTGKTYAIESTRRKRKLPTKIPLNQKEVRHEHTRKTMV